MRHRRRLILGTAGHIDHGKTSLVRALTGIDCDRLPEEKQRGITIDIGFAHLELTDLQIGIVDVPGHERFVRNMLAGASGIDLVLLVVAADDSVMPQTREHLEILKLLGVSHGLVALTKIDLVEPDWVEMVEQDVRRLVAGTFLESAPIIRTSATSLNGIDELRTAIEQACRRIEEEPPGDLFRLAVDRSFVVPGRGTVVTGTVWAGSIAVGDEVEWLPPQHRIRIRGLQSHGESVNRIGRGQRAAINLLGVHHREILRGHELATPGYLLPSKLLTATISLLPDAPRPVKHRGQVRVHLGTQEHIATVSLLDRTNVAPGATCMAQLHCADPAIATAGQPFVLRDVSPVTTIGGGRVLQPVARRIRRRYARELDSLHELASTDATIRAAAAIRMIGLQPWADLELARDAALSLAQAAGVVPELVQRGWVVYLAGRTSPVHRDALEQAERQILRMLQALHAKNPMERTVPRSRLTASLGRRIPEESLALILGRMLHRHQIVGDDAGGVALPQATPKLTESQSRLRQHVLEQFESAGLAPPDVAALARTAGVTEKQLRPVIDLCLAEQQLVHIGGGMFLHRSAETLLRRRIVEIFDGRGRLTVSQIRELLGTSRKYAIPFCEYLDRAGVTKRLGDERQLATTVELREAKQPAG